jgi:hypothetical protein
VTGLVLGGGEDLDGLSEGVLASMVAACLEAVTKVHGQRGMP